MTDYLIAFLQTVAAIGVAGFVAGCLFLEYRRFHRFREKQK